MYLVFKATAVYRDTDAVVTHSCCCLSLSLLKNLIVLEFLSNGDLRSWLKDRNEESALAYVHTDSTTLCGCVNWLQTLRGVCVCVSMYA